MKKIMTLAAVAALVFSACAKIETIETNEAEAITFGVYTGNSATKAVSATTFGNLNTNTLLQGSVGFGVFAYYSDAVLPNGTAGSTGYVASPSNFTPNFMYNQKVEYDTDHWKYSPLKYWPNEYNTSDAIGEGVDKLTFFAYAPYVATVGDEGITAFSANTATGDPTVTFKVPANKDNQIDLLWSDADTKNMVKQPITSGDVHFTFKHALSNLTILPVAVVDAKGTIPASNGTNVDAATAVKINSITLKGQFNQEGTLNLATGVWTSSAAASDQTVSWTPATAFDVTAYNDKAEIDAYYTANPSVLPAFMFIPSSTADKDYVITIDYDFITTDAAVSGGTVTVHNVIHKTLENLEFQKSKKMKLYVGLGMTSVVLSAEVADWTTINPASEVWLPVNL